MIRRTKTIFQCDRCKKEIEYDLNDDYDYINPNICHHFTAKEPGYGGSYDRKILAIDLCDDCLKALYDEFGIEPPDSPNVEI